MDQGYNSYDDSYDTGDLPEIARVTPRMHGHGLALPPLAPVVGALCLLFGLLVGFGLAPRIAQSGSGPLAIAVATPSPTPAVDEGVVTTLPREDTLIGALPTDGLSLAEALKALSSVGLGVSLNDVTAARIARYSDVSFSSGAPADQWVWVFEVRTYFFSSDDGMTTVDRGISWSVLPELVDPSSAVSGTVTDERRVDSGVAITGSLIMPATQTIILDYYTGELLEATSMGYFQSEALP
jgi:hypothetical protein